MATSYRTDGAYLGTCRCGCGQEIYETVWRWRETGWIKSRKSNRYVRGHNLHGIDNFRTPKGTNRGNIQYAMKARAALTVPLGAELHEVIQRRRRELGLSVSGMMALLGWKGDNNLHRYACRTNVMLPTIHRVLDALYAEEGGWVEAAPLWVLARRRQSLWGLTAAEMAEFLGTAETHWIGKQTARRILLALNQPRQPCAAERERKAS